VQALICDDDWRLRRLYRLEFEWAGAEVIEAGNGDQCLDLAVREKPDVIVLDLHMPRRGGLAVLPTLKRACPDVPVLVVTAYAGTDVFNYSRRLGATACFSKPGFLSQIPDVVDKYRPQPAGAT
jgi:CheY-like chemotaxis protein